MSDTPAANAAQIDYWNAIAGHTWAQFQERLDRQIGPPGREAMRALAPVVGEHILDVGCGCGQTTLALAVHVGAEGGVTGVDVSAPMLEVARARAAAAGAPAPQFRQIDAQTGDLGEHTFDAVYSRFGVMFFSDPVAAFANLRKALKRDGRLAFVCWRPLQENLWMRAPMDAARPFLPPSPPADPTAPGPFAFADAERLGTILTDAGFTDVRIGPFDTLIGGFSVDEAVDLAFRVGPLGAILRDNPGQVAVVADAVRRAIGAFETPDGVLMPAAVWIVQARAG